MQKLLILFLLVFSLSACSSQFNAGKDEKSQNLILSGSKHDSIVKPPINTNTGLNVPTSNF